MEPDDEFIFCLDRSGQECWKQITSWTKQNAKIPGLKDALQEFEAVLEVDDFTEVDADSFMQLACSVLPFISGARPYKVFCLVRIVQEFCIDDEIRGAIGPRVLDFARQVIVYLQLGLDSEDVKNLLGAVTDVVRLLLQCGEASLASYLQLFLSVAGAADTPLEVSRQLLATTNQLLEPLQRAQRTAVRGQLDAQLPALLRLLNTCGDYDVQASLVECLFRLSTQPERPTLAAAWLPSDELRRAFVAIVNFDPDCRLLLNAYNRRLGAARAVHSFPAASVTLAGYALQKPDDPDYQHMWVDFNEGSGAVTVYCQRPVTDTQPDESLWETVTVRRDDVARARLRLDPDHQLLTLTLERPCRQLLSSGSLAPFDGREATLVFRKGHDLHTVLGRLYGAAYKFQACEAVASERTQKASAAIGGVHCRSSATTVSSSAGGSRAQKASVPLSTVSSAGSGARPAARRPVGPKSSVPVLAGQRRAGSGAHYRPLQMSSPGRELRRQRASPAPEEAAPADPVSVSQSSGPSVIEPTQRPPASRPGKSGPSTPAVSSVQGDGRAPREHRRPAAAQPDSSPGDDEEEGAGDGDRRDARGLLMRDEAEDRAHDATTDGEARGREDFEVQEEEDEPNMQDDEPQAEDENELEIQDGKLQRQQQDKSEIQNTEDGLHIQEEDEPQMLENEPEMHQKEDKPKMQEEDKLEMAHEDELDVWGEGELELQKIQPQQDDRTQPDINSPSERRSPGGSDDFEASPRRREPSPPAEEVLPAADRSHEPTDRPAVSTDNRQRASRRPRAAACAVYCEISDSSSRSGGSGEPSPRVTEPKRRPAGRRPPPADTDVNNNTSPAAVSGASRQRTDRGKRAREPAHEAVTTLEEARDEPCDGEAPVRGTGAEMKAGKSVGNAKAPRTDRSRAKQGVLKQPAERGEKPACVTFDKQKTVADGDKKKRSLFLARDSSSEASPVDRMETQHSVFSQSDSGDSDLTVPWRMTGKDRRAKKTRYPRSPHIFSDIATSTDGERLPAPPPPPEQHVGTFKRYPVYDPRSVRNKALLREEAASTQPEPARRGGRGGRGRGGRGKRGGAGRRGAASKRGAGRAQPAGGWAERVSLEEPQLRSPEVLRDEPAPAAERAVSDVDVPPAKRRPDPGLASCFGWDSPGVESGARQTELSPPVPAASSRAARRFTARQRAGQKQNPAQTERRVGDIEPPVSGQSPAEMPPHAPHDQPAGEMELSGQHEVGAELELSVPPAPADASGSGHASHLSVSANESAPPVACPPNTPLSAGGPSAAPPAAPTAAQLGDAMQWQAVSPQRTRQPRDPAALTATQEFRLDAHLALEEEASRPASPSVAELSLHRTDSPLPSPIHGPGANVNAASPVSVAVESQRRGESGAQPRAVLPPSGAGRPPPPPLTGAAERRPLLNDSLLLADEIRAELSGLVADWETASGRSEPPRPALLQAVAAIRRQVARLDERDERLLQLGRRSAAALETLLAQQRAAVATLGELGEAAAVARRQAADRILAECERMERATQEPARPAPAPTAAAAAAGSELESVQRELEQLLHAGPAPPQLEWPRY